MIFCVLQFSIFGAMPYDIFLELFSLKRGNRIISFHMLSIIPFKVIFQETNCSHVLNYQFQWQFSFNLRNFPYWNKFLRGLIFEFCVANSDQIRKSKSSQNFWYTYYQINVHEECKQKTYYIWFLVKNISSSLLQRFGILKLQNLITKSSYAKWRHTSSY